MLNFTSEQAYSTIGGTANAGNRYGVSDDVDS